MILNKRSLRYWINSCASFMVVSCSTELSTEIKAAISELKEIESKIEIGVNISDYKSAVADAKVMVDRAIETNPTSETNQKIKKSLDGYISALELWRCKFISERYDNWASDKCRTNVYETVIFKQYPKLKAQIEPYKSEYSSTLSVYSVNHDEVIQKLWVLSSTELN